MRRRLAAAGSMEYSETWKAKATPAGRRYLAHTASVRRTSGSGVYWVAYAPGQRLFREQLPDATGVGASLLGAGPESNWKEYHGCRISSEPGDVPLVDAIPSGMGFGEPALRRLVQGARANLVARLRAYGNAVVPQLAALFVRSAAEAVAEGNEQMGAGRNTGYTPGNTPSASGAPTPGSPIALSFFSGAMGLDLGLELAGFSLRLASETDKDAAATIRGNRPDIPLIGDIHEYTAAQVRAAAGAGDADVDLVAGGPPCQTYSTAGNRQALEDVRGIAILKLASLAVEVRPEVCCH